MAFAACKTFHYSYRNSVIESTFRYPESPFRYPRKSVSVHFGPFRSVSVHRESVSVLRESVSVSTKVRFGPFRSVSVRSGPFRSVSVYRDTG